LKFIIFILNNEAETQTKAKTVFITSN